MGLAPELAARHAAVHERLAVDMDVLRRRVWANRHVTVGRGEIEELLYARVKDTLPVRFGVTAAALAQEVGRVAVTFADGTTGAYDLVVGADGLHSHSARWPSAPRSASCARSAMRWQPSSWPPRCRGSAATPGC
jgi:2-polyprenyl-6-methoxyphenol hydroxylase-like FAD-dependent oxidoreductase